MTFENIRHLPLADISPSQIYISEEKLRRIRKWFSPEALLREPLPVRDFGHGRYTFTDGHTRAMCAYLSGMRTIPAIYDSDPIVSTPEAHMLYRMDVEWCRRFGILTIADLSARIISGADYTKLWHARCDAAYELMTRTTAARRAAAEARHPGLFIYGMSADAQTLYFENAAGDLFEFPEELP